MKDSVRVISLDLLRSETAAASRSPRHCEAPGCRESTWDKKPYCADHISSGRYVAQILERIKEHEAESAKVRAGKACPRSLPLLSEDLLYALKEGKKTLNKVCQDLGFGKEACQEGGVLYRLVLDMAERGQLTLGRTKRRNLTVELAA